MKMKILWILVSFLMSISLVIASCGPSAEEEVITGEEEEEEEEEEGGVTTSGKNMVTVTLEKLDGTTMTKSVEKPQYGGTITSIRTGPYYSHDPMNNMAVMVGHMQLTSNELIGGKWTVGPQGTGEVDWLYGHCARIELEAGELAESWELPDDETIIYNLKKGIRYHDKPPVNGRELVAEDVAWWLEQQYWHEGLWQNVAFKPEQRPTSFKALDKYTVEVKVPPEWQGIALTEMGDNAYVNPPECWTEYGGWGSDWEKVIGTGPFIMVDYLPDSVVSYVRNPNYFEHDPIHPDNQWPYIEKYKELIISDASTRLAAFRTGKVDYINDLGYDDAKLLLDRIPELGYSKRFSWHQIPAGRIDAPPFNDLRVRQAMNLAVNNQEIIDEFYSGDGEIHAVPFPPNPTYEPYYTPLEELPEEVKMLFTYDVEKAKQLMAEAGYPEGFKTRILCRVPEVDLMSLLREYLLAIGIDMEIVPLESGAHQSIRVGKQQKAGEMMNGTIVWAPDQPLSTKAGGQHENHAWVDDPYYDNLMTVIGRDIIKDPANFQKTVKEAVVYMLASAWGIWIPRQYKWNLYWPWMKNYYGITSVGWYGAWDQLKIVWVDQDLKKSMGY